MHPELFGSVQAYSVFLVVGDLVGGAVAFACAHRAGVNPRRFAVALVALTAAAVLGAKLYGLIERRGAFGALPAELFAGYRYPGALLAVAVAAAILARFRWLAISPGKLADLITPSFGFAMAVVRIGCLLAGCCAGTTSNVPWAIHFPAHSQVWHAHVEAGLLAPDAPLSLAVHPLQLYFGVLSLALGCFALWFERHKRYDGQVFLAYVAAYGAGQFLLEFLRFSPLPHVQYLSAAIAVGAALLLVANAGRSRSGPASASCLSRVQPRRSVAAL